MSETLIIKIEDRKGDIIGLQPISLPLSRNEELRAYREIGHLRNSEEISERDSWVAIAFLRTYLTNHK